jgi:hypothetical protein
MDKLITALYVLYFVSYMMGCSVRQTTDYEMRFWMDRGENKMSGYVKIEGKEYPITVEYSDDD